MEAIKIVHADLFSGDDEVQLAVAQQVVSAFGPCGRGFLVVTAVPGLMPLRDHVLAVAARAASLSDKELRSFRKQNQLGTDIPSRGVPPHQRRVTTSALQLSLPVPFDKANGGEGGAEGSLRESLGAITKLISEAGIRLLELCDLLSPSGCSLAATVRRGGTAKTRLIHYHKLPTPKTPQKPINEKGGGLWQEWHFDYGLLTGLLAPTYRYVDPGHTEEALFDGEISDGSGLIVLDRHGSSSSPVEPVADDSLIFQVGEAAQILSGGELAATVHCVRRPPADDGQNLSRQTCVVFMQPHWSEVLTPPEAVTAHQVLLASEDSNPVCTDDHDERACRSDAASTSPACLCPEDVPPLRVRWREGQLYGEFSKSTIQHYYAHKEQHNVPA